MHRRAAQARARLARHRARGRGNNRNDPATIMSWAVVRAGFDAELSRVAAADPIVQLGGLDRLHG
jgi:hypothetical protein